MDAVFNSTVCLLMAASIDASLLQDHSPWSQRAYGMLDEMTLRGNLSARLIQSELKQLDEELTHLEIEANMKSAQFMIPYRVPIEGGCPEENVPQAIADDHLSQSMELAMVDFGQHYELSSNQLIDLADSLDFESLSWPFQSLITGAQI